MTTAELTFDVVRERDMDLLFANALCTETGFTQLLLSTENA